MMELPKLDSLLNLSLSLPAPLRSGSEALSAASDGSYWTVIALTSGDITYLTEHSPQITVTSLYEGFAVITLPPRLLPALASIPEILYVEMPRYLSFEQTAGLRASCITPVVRPPLSLTGNGVLVGIVDSGIDLFHPAFRNRDGSTRVRFLWDQEASGTPPAGYSSGAEYTEADINAALSANRILTTDRSGHGTAVAGIACGGISPETGNRGVAAEATLIVVKMRNEGGVSPLTPSLMEGINYCIEKSLSQNQPLALNLSYGMNYGSHTGTSLLETYLNRVSQLGRISITVASGNEGASPIHTSGFLSSVQEIPIAVGLRQGSLTLQLWKDHSDLFSIVLTGPSGQSYVLPDAFGAAVFSLDRTQIAFYNAAPSPFQRLQEYLFEWIPENEYIPSGIWTLRLTPLSIRNGNYQLWLPGNAALNRSTRFLYPTPDNTLTIPSTAPGVITAGAYDPATDSPAAFSGRGPLGLPSLLIKPDLVAPGVSIPAPASPDTYQLFSGTSFAAPFVTGSCALLMEWGIIRANSPYLYGEKLKAWLISGTRELPGYPAPNNRTGWGALCLEAAFPSTKANKS